MLIVVNSEYLVLQSWPMLKFHGFEETFVTVIEFRTRNLIEVISKSQRGAVIYESRIILLSNE